MTVTEKAFLIALAAHEGQMRKTTNVPYIMHPVAVALSLARAGFSDEVVAAALAHDVLEDTTVTEDTLRNELGDAVVDLVMGVTENKGLPWPERKKLYIEHVRSASDEVKAISVADKIHNAKGYLEAYELLGVGMWEKFSRGKDEQLWFIDSMLSMLQESFKHPLVAEYAKLVEKIHAIPD